MPPAPIEKTTIQTQCEAASAYKMQCTKPITAWYGDVKANGKRGLVFKRPAASANRNGDIEIPCGRCMDCRLEYSRQWAVRCMHEAKLYEQNSFITLTYDNDNLPNNGTLVKSDLQNFYKRLRKKLQPQKIRHYSCGEYGDENNRPHYHAIVFNYFPPDACLYKRTKTGDLFTSDQLAKIWKNGNVIIGQVTFETANYVAKYATKKINGEKALAHYRRVDPDTGEIIQLKPEFATMSLKPGIAYRFYESYKRDFYPSDEVISRGQQMKPPKYYDRKLEKENPELYEKVKEKRIAKAKEKGRTQEQQLKAHAKITQAKMSLKKRNVE